MYQKSQKSERDGGICMYLHNLWRLVVGRMRSRVLALAPIISSAPVHSDVLSSAMASESGPFFLRDCWSMHGGWLTSHELAVPYAVAAAGAGMHGSLLLVDMSGSEMDRWRLRGQLLARATRPGAQLEKMTMPQNCSCSCGIPCRLRNGKVNTYALTLKLPSFFPPFIYYARTSTIQRK